MTNPGTEPLVSVVTPVYNGAPYLAECIESILGQSYENFEYLIVNNCSTDRTLDIARSYAARDSRVRLHDNEQFLDVIGNHNLAFRLISPESKYCKVVCADDFIFPDCLERLVEVAEADESVSIVGCYQLSGSVVRWQGFAYPQAVFPGHDICRRIFLGDVRSFGCGSPTSLLYRADLVRKSEAFYPNSSPHADTSACLRDLKDTSFGFVYQVLSYERTHPGTQSSRSAKLNRYWSAYLSDLIQYGPWYLTGDELRGAVRNTLRGYYEFLGASLLEGKDGEFWDYHRGRLQELGHPFRPLTLLRVMTMKVLQELLNPGQAFSKVMAHLARSYAPVSQGAPRDKL